MDPDFTVLFLVLIGSILFALVLRFVQPELLYGLRQVLLEVQTNKIFLDHEAGRLGLNPSFQELLVKDFRLESPESDERYVFKRITKIRELYRSLDPRRPLAEKHFAKGLQPNVCIVELASLLSSLGRDAVPMTDYHQPTVSGRGILTHIANEVRKSQGGTLLSDDESVLRWFRENPLSGEQAIEIMIAAAYGLALRQASTIKVVSAKPEPKVLPAEEPPSETAIQTASRSQLDPKDSQAASTETLSTILKVERKLRVMVQAEYQEKYSSELRGLARVESVLGEKTYNECLRKMEKSRSMSRGLALDFLDFLYIGELETLIFGEWEEFRHVFGDKAWLKQRMTMIIQVRNEVAHGRNVSRHLEYLALGYCGEIDERIDDWTRSMELPQSL